jgi:hypothetical protein
VAVLRPAKAAVTYTESSGEDVGMTTAKKFLMRSRRTRWHNLRTRENNVGGGGELQWPEMEEARGGVGVLIGAGLLGGARGQPWHAWHCSGARCDIGTAEAEKNRGMGG